jgi:hypothetical protein
VNRSQICAVVNKKQLRIPDHVLLGDEQVKLGFINQPVLIWHTFPKNYLLKDRQVDSELKFFC